MAYDLLARIVPRQTGLAQKYTVLTRRAGAVSGALDARPLRAQDPWALVFATAFPVVLAGLNAAGYRYQYALEALALYGIGDASVLRLGAAGP